MDEIMVGDALLDYFLEAKSISSLILEGKEQLVYAKIYGQASYSGKAEEEISSFYNSMETHLLRLANFFEVAAQYIWDSYEKFYYNEEQLAQWIIENLGSGE